MKDLMMKGSRTLIALMGCTLLLLPNLTNGNPLSKLMLTIRSVVIDESIELVNPDNPKFDRFCIYKSYYVTNRDDFLHESGAFCLKTRRKNLKESPSKFYCKKPSKAAYDECASHNKPLHAEEYYKSKRKQKQKRDKRMKIPEKWRKYKPL